MLPYRLKHHWLDLTPQLGPLLLSSRLPPEVLQGSSILVEADVAVKYGQVKTRKSNNSTNTSKNKSKPSIDLLLFPNPDPNTLPHPNQEHNNKVAKQPIKILVILPAHTIINILAVMVELLHAPLASIAVVTVPMNIHPAFLTINQQVLVVLVLAKSGC